MADLDRIPIEARWGIASRSISALAIAYGMALENALRKGSDGIAEAVWQQRGDDARVYASAFGMPAGNARELAEALGTVSRIMYGPEYDSRLMRSADDVAVIYTMQCPLLNRMHEVGAEPGTARIPCRAFATATVEGMNPAYTVHLRKGMCQGDEYCQMNIERKSG